MSEKILHERRDEKREKIETINQSTEEIALFV